MTPRLWMLPAGVLFSIFVLHVCATLLGTKYDIDIDHMMYFGGRLLHGELVWTREFDDKLPVVQILFALPAAAGSIRMWQFLSILSVVLGAFSLYWGLKLLLSRDWGLPSSKSQAIALSAATLYLYFTAVLPGSLSHINPMAASLLSLATVLLLVKGGGKKGLLRGAPSSFIVSVFFASVAVSMRPHFLAPALLAGLWVALRGAVVSEAFHEATAIRTPARAYVLAFQDFLLWATAMGIIGLILNAGPYILTGQIDSFLDGLQLLSQKLTPMSMLDVVQKEFSEFKRANDLTVFVIIAWCAFAFWFLAGMVRNHDRKTPDIRISKIDILFAVVLSPLALELMILSKHFWQHYQQFFIPYATISVAFLMASLSRLKWFQGRGPRAAVALSLFLTAALLVAVRGDFKQAVVSLVLSKDYSHKWAADRTALQDYFEKRHLVNVDFLNPSHMYLHWTLDQSRHGFPHASHTEHIFNNWWVKVRKPMGLDIPTIPEEYCEKIEQKGPRFVVDRPDEQVLSCFTKNPQSRYKQVELLNIGTGRQVVVYERME